jgi:hypothetical protein
MKAVECDAAGAALLHLLEVDIKPRDIMTVRPNSVSFLL